MDTNKVPSEVLSLAEWQQLDDVVRPGPKMRAPLEAVVSARVRKG